MWIKSSNSYMACKTSAKVTNGTGNFATSLAARWFFLEYLQSTISSLILTGLPTHNNHPPDETISRLTGCHFSSLTRPNKAYKVCYAKGKCTDKGHKTRTTSACAFCSSKPGLHPDSCFEKYHTKIDFSE